MCDLVSIYTAKNTIEADYLVSIFLSNGINAVKKGINDTGFLEVYAGYSLYLVEILVSRDDKDKANMLLDEIFGKNDLEICK